MKKSLGTMVAIMVVTILIGTFIMAKSSTAGETGRDGRFIAYDNGTVLDTRTNLMWAAKDNGSDITWYNAKSYFENYRAGGYTDWRMPTQDELAGLYDTRKFRPQACDHTVSSNVATELIDMTCGVLWASTASGSVADYFDFGSGGIKSSITKSQTWKTRALPVRSGK
jgi:hypothetical protein